MLTGVGFGKYNLIWLHHYKKIVSRKIWNLTCNMAIQILHSLLCKPRQGRFSNECSFPSGLKSNTNYWNLRNPLQQVAVHVSFRKHISRLKAHLNCMFVLIQNFSFLQPTSHLWSPKQEMLPATQNVYWLWMDVSEFRNSIWPMIKSSRQPLM